MRGGAELAASRPVLVVPGGGPFADAVRAVDEQVGLDDDVAHALALRAMDQLGVLLAPLLPAAELLARPGRPRAPWASCSGAGVRGPPRGAGVLGGDQRLAGGAGGRRDRRRRGGPAQAGRRRAGAVAVGRPAAAGADRRRAAGAAGARRRTGGRRLPARGGAPHRCDRRGPRAGRRPARGSPRAERAPARSSATAAATSSASSSAVAVAAAAHRRAHADDVGGHATQLAQQSTDPRRRSSRRRFACARPNRRARTVDNHEYRPRPSLTNVSTSAPAIPVRSTTPGSHAGASAGGSSAAASAYAAAITAVCGPTASATARISATASSSSLHPSQSDLDVVGAAERRAPRGQRRRVREIRQVAQRHAHRRGATDRRPPPRTARAAMAPRARPRPDP